jgi:hypothetical protein
MRHRILAVLSLAFGMVAGCGATGRPEPVIVTKTVSVPVPVPCSAARDLGPDPAYALNPATVSTTPSLFGLVVLLLADREQRIAREGELKAAIEGCGDPP